MMKLALIGHPISHSLSPEIYKSLLGENLKYDLLDIPLTQELPSLLELSKVYDGINITSPYKKNYVGQIEIDDPIVKKLKTINTISFTPNGFKGTNTDLIALRLLLTKYCRKKNLKLWILGDGSMASMIIYLANERRLDFEQFSRSLGSDISRLDLKPKMSPDKNHLLINACSRDFIFQGTLSKECIFWDLNYRFLPHQKAIPALVKSYIDGQELLTLQAKAALDFWKATNPKLKC